MDAGWLPAIVDDVEFQYSIWADGSPSPMSTSFGSVTISLEHVLRTHDLTRLHFDGAVATIWLGDAGAPFSNFTRVFTGAMGPLVRDDDRSAKITLLGPESALVRDLLTDSFQGTGNIEGPAEMVGRLKPVAFGAVTNVEPILIDAASLIYMVDAASPVTAVFENALTLDAPAATLDSFTALKSATIAPGKWARAPGMFRLGSQPSGKITADAGTASTVNATIVALLRRAGIADAKIGDTIRQASVAYNLYVTDQTTILDAVRNAAFAAGQYLIADAAGVWHLAPFVSTKVAGRLTADRSSEPLVLPDTIRALPAAAPAWRVKVAHSRVWSVNSSNEISPALRDQAMAIAAVTKAADDAAVTADLAMADAIFARARVENQAKDGVLDRTEKLQLVRDFEGYTAERATLIATGQGLEVTTEVTAYVTAYANLKSYLEGLSPAYNDTTADTIIDATTYKSRLTGYTVARQNLDNANANHAAQRANWTSVEDRPKTLTALDLTAGKKLDTVEEGADVTGKNTSKDTSNVGGRPSSQIVAGIDKLPDIRADIDKALAAGQAVADREIVAATPPGTVSNIQWSSVLTDGGADVTLTWTAGTNATSYEVELGENGGGGIVFAAPATSYRFAAKRNTAYSARIRALKINVSSGWVSAPAFSTGRDTVAPAAPTGLTTSPGITWVDVSTIAPADSDQAKIRFTLYRSSDNAKIADATVSATANTRAETRFSNLSRMAAYYVAAVAIDSSENASSATANVSVATINTSIDDLTPGLVPPQTVTSLPAASGWNGSPVVFYAGELYRLVNGTWSKAVSGQDITASTISTDKLVNAAITADKIASSAISTDKLVNSAITAEKLAAASVTETRLADFSVANVKLAPNSVDAYKIIDGAVGSTKIATAAITEVKIANDAISAPKIQANAITADKIAANAITARTLALGSFDNIIPDGQMRDLDFWNGLTSSGPGAGVSAVKVQDQNNQWRFSRTMVISPVDTYWFTPFFPVEIGATYKLDYQIYTSPDFNGWLNISLHHPGISWRSIKSNISGFAPDANDTSGINTFHVGDTHFNPKPCIFTVPDEANHLTRQMQFRFDGHWSVGYVEFMVNIVRVSDATLIKDGSVETNKIAANAITADKIAANSISANKLTVSSRPVSTFGMAFRVDPDGKLRWEAGYVQYTDDNGSYVSAYVLAGEVAYSGTTIFFFYRPGRGVIDVTTVEQIQNDPSVFFLGKWHGNGASLNMSSGVGTYINGAQIVTGSIFAEKIAAGSITTEKLSVTPYGGALNSNPYVNDNSAWFGIGGGAGVKSITDGKAGVYVMEISGANNSVVEKRSVPFDPSKQYVFRCLARRASGGTTSVIFAGVAVFDANGTNITGDGSYWYYVASGVNVGSEWTQFTGYFGAGKRTFPSNAKTMAVCLFGNYGGNYDSVHQFQDVRIEEVLPGTLIQDGVITTDKIAANAITANKLVVASRPVSSSELNLNYKDGLLSWDAGNIVSVDANGGTAVYRVRSGNVRGAGYLLYLPGNDYLDYNPDPVYVANSSFIKIAYYDGGQRLNLIAGVSTTINGNNIVTGTISSDKITARTIEAGNIKAGTISGYELAANTISTNNLVVASRPVSMSGVNMRITTDGVLRWDAGTVRIVNTVGSTDTYNVSGGETGSQDCMVVYVPGRTYFDLVTDRNVFLPNSEHIKIADRTGLSDLKVYAGVSTILSGDRIVTGSINADKIQARTIGADRLAANSITANEILAGTITAAQIATSALTARVLAVGNPDNIIGDSGYNDASWWNGGNADGRLTVGESGMIETGRELKVTSSGRSDFYSMFFPVELGATYRVSVGVYTYGDFNGRFRPVIHMPNWAWLNLKAGTGVDPEDSNPALNWTSASSYFRNEFVVTNPANTLECKKWQFRLIGDWTGTLAFVCKIVRVSDTTLIKDGAITTDKITVNSLNGDRIAAGTLSADKIAANSVISNTITVANTSGNLGDAVERARDPAYRINNGVGTQINPGLINISGGTTLASWRNGGDNTKIEGGSIAANTISANKLTIGNRGLGFIGLNFEWNPNNNYVNWSDGYIYHIDDNGNQAQVYISSGNTAGAVPHRFIYWNKGDGFLSHDQSFPVGDNKVMIATWWGGSNLNVNYGGTIINGDRITTGSIDANRIKANTVLANTVIVGGRGTVGSAFDSAKWNGISGAGKPLTFTVGARGNQTSSLPSGYNHGLRGPDGQVYADGSYPGLRTDAYNRSYTVCWTNGGEVWGIRHFDVYGNGTVAYEGGYGSSAGSMAQLLRDISFGSTIVIYTSDEPSNNRLNDGLPNEMYNCGASRSVFGSANFPSWSSYILIGQKGVGEGNGTEYFSAGGANSYVRATFSIVNGVPSIGGASIKDARDLAFSDGRGVDVLRGVQENATVGAPAGTYVGNSLAQTVESWANTGAQDPVGRINSGTTTINGGRITTGSITANQIAANTITADRLNVASLSALSANIGDVTAGVVRNASGSAKFDLNAGRIIFDNGSVMKVSGNGFGSSGQFIEWFGPRKANLADCTEANASYYLKTDGSSYFGGSLSAGTIKNAIGTSSTATNANVTTGSVGSRGGTRVVVLSYSWSWSQSVDKPQNEGSGSDLSAQVVLSRNGADVATLTATGSWYRDPAFSSDEPGYYREGIGGSLTFTDNSGGSSVTYSARLTVRNTGPGPQNGSTRGGTATQNISIVQTEQ